jgi:hypothetical protein
MHVEECRISCKNVHERQIDQNQYLEGRILN